MAGTETWSLAKHPEFLARAQTTPTRLIHVFNPLPWDCRRSCHRVADLMSFFHSLVSKKPLLGYGRNCVIVTLSLSRSMHSKMFKGRAIAQYYKANIWQIHIGHNLTIWCCCVFEGFTLSALCILTSGKHGHLLGEIKLSNDLLYFHAALLAGISQLLYIVFTTWLNFYIVLLNDTLVQTAPGNSYPLWCGVTNINGHFS